MFLQTQSDPRRLKAANAPHLRRFGKAVEWTLSLSFAALLGTAVWELDNDGLSSAVDATPSAVAAPGPMARIGAVARGLLETLVERDETQHGISAAQSPPEGWPLWTNDPARRSMAAPCHSSAPPPSQQSACR